MGQPFHHLQMCIRQLLCARYGKGVCVWGVVVVHAYLCKGRGGYVYNAQNTSPSLGRLAFSWWREWHDMKRMMLKGIQNLASCTKAARTYFVNVGKSLNLPALQFLYLEFITKSNETVFLNLLWAIQYKRWRHGTRQTHKTHKWSLSGSERRSRQGSKV